MAAAAAAVSVVVLLAVAVWARTTRRLVTGLYSLSPGLVPTWLSHLVCVRARKERSYSSECVSTGMCLSSVQTNRC